MLMQLPSLLLFCLLDSQIDLARMDAAIFPQFEARLCSFSAHLCGQKGVLRVVRCQNKSRVRRSRDGVDARVAFVEAAILFHERRHQVVALRIRAFFLGLEVDADNLAQVLLRALFLAIVHIAFVFVVVEPQADVLVPLVLLRHFNRAPKLIGLFNFDACRKRWVYTGSF